MVTIKNMGRFANFGYQMANCISYALKNNLPFSAPSVARDPKWHPIYFPHLINPSFVPTLPTILIQEKQHSYYEIPFSESWRDQNIMLEGYWQSYKYFDWCIDNVRELFGFKYETEKGICGLHVRRGDFLQYPDKHILPPDKGYYDLATHLIKKETDIEKIRVYSDDIPWCKEHYKNGLHGFEYEFSEGKNELQDFEGLMNCEAIICAASTFSVLAGTLSTNKHKVVVAPGIGNFFGPVGRHLDLTTMYPRHFYTIDY